MNPFRHRFLNTASAAFAFGAAAHLHAANPIVTDVFTADPAPLVVGDTVYLYCGQDDARTPRDGYRMPRWLCYSTKDMKTWKPEGSPLKPADFSWAAGDAWASQVIERNGKYYWYVATTHQSRGKAIGVAVADSPTGPFVDARGSALVTNDMTQATKINYDDIDPTVWIEDNGQAWLFWGNQKCYYAKLKETMTELDGPIQVIPDEQVPKFTEAPWIHKRDNLYYLSYATGFPEKVAYSTATSLEGPWTPRGLLAEGAFNSSTIHQGIITFKGADYFVYHNGASQIPREGGGSRRSVCVDYLYYNPDGTMRRVIQTSEGTDLPPAELSPSAVRTASAPPPESEMAAYLLVYFKDETHGLHFALSSDGYSFTSLNEDRPIFKGPDIAEQKGIRDPYIMRGPDNNFYMAMTDLHIFAKRELLRGSDWERDGAAYGWGNNRGLVLMKSPDLVNWSHSVLRVDQAFPSLADIGCAWAPSMIWDAGRNRMLMHFTMRFGNGRNRLYYAYVDPSFSRLESEPALLFQYPKESVNYIDSDITKIGDKFILAYTPQDPGPGVKIAVSDSLTSGYNYQEAWVPAERGACEAPSVWKRIGENKWVIMFDAYTAKPHDLGFTETSDFKTFTPLGRFNRGVMKAVNFSQAKHGAVIHLTADEAQRLAKHWSLEKY